MEELNLQKFSWIDMDEFEMQLIEFQSSSIWKQKFIDLRVDLQNIEKKQLEKGILSLPTLVGGANGGSEIVKMWKDYLKGILNSESSANESAESVDHSIDRKENYLGLEMAMCSFVSLAALLQKLPLNKAPWPDCISAEHLLYAD